MSQITRQATPKPYDGPLDHLADEIAWVQVRCHRLGAEIEAIEQTTCRCAPRAAMTEADRMSGELRERLTRLRNSESNLRRRIDERVAATTPTLPLVELAEALELEEVEVTLLKLAVIPSLGFALYDALASVSRFSFGLLSVSPEMLAVFAGLDLPGRVRLRDMLGEDGKLVGAGWIEIALNEGRLEDFWSAELHLTEKAYRRLVRLED